MKLDECAVGVRVTVIESDEGCPPIGSKGEVVGIEYGSVLVDFDDWRQGHNGGRVVPEITSKHRDHRAYWLGPEQMEIDRDQDEDTN